MIAKLFGRDKTAPRYTLEDFSKLHAELTAIDLQDQAKRSVDRVVKILQQMAEIVVWGEQNDEDFFMYFCEKNILQYFVGMLRSQTDQNITVQMLQSIGIIAHNVKRKQSVYILLSNNHLNDIILHPFDFEDEDIIKYYINLIKGLSVRLTAETLQFHLNNGGCPLLTQAQKFYNFPESMVRVGGRTAALSIMNIRDPVIVNSVLRSNLLLNFICYMRDIWVKADELMAMQEGKKLADALENQIDNLLYLQDIFQLENSEIASEAAEISLHYLFLPVVVGSIGAEKRNEYSISLSLAIYALLQTMTHLRHPGILNCMVESLFGQKVGEVILDTVMTPAKPAPEGYCFEWTITPDELWPSEPEPFPHLLTQSEIMSEEGERAPKADNPVRSIFFSFLRSKDDNLIFLTTQVFQQILENRLINAQLLWQCGLVSNKFAKKQALLDNILRDQELEEDKDRVATPAALYNTELMELLLNLLATVPPFRLITVHLLGKTIMQFAVDKKGVSGLLPEHLTALNAMLLEATGQLRTLISCGLFDSNFMDYFEQEWGDFAAFDISAKIRYNPSFLLYDYDQPKEDVPLTHRLPFGDFETARRDLQRFFFLRKMRHGLTNDSSDINANPLNEFQGPQPWVEGESYQMDNRRFVRCYLRQGRMELVKYLAEDNDHFILVEPDRLKIYFAKVSHIRKLRNIDVRVDSEIPTILIVMIMEDKGKSPQPLILVFEDVPRCMWAYNRLKEHKKLSAETDLAILNDFLSSIEHSISSA